MIAENEVLKRLPDEDDGNKFREKIQIDDDRLMMPMIILMNTMLINGYQSV